MTTLEAILAIVGGLVGFPAFLTILGAALVLLKVPLNQEAFMFWGNVVGFVGVAFFVFTGRLELLGAIDAALSTIAAIIANLLILLGGAAVSLGLGFRMQTKAQEINVRQLFRR